MDAANLMRVLLSSKPPPGSLSPDDYEMWSYMHEFPLLWPACVAAGMFGLIAILNLAVTVKTRAWFMITIGLTAILECLGYAARIAIIQSWSYGGYVAMMCLLIISPVLLAIVNYIVVGRLMRLADQDALKAAHLNPRWFAVLFTLSDILCLALQGAGAGMLAGSDASSVEMGRKLLLAGLFMQIAFFTMYTVLTIIIHSSRSFGLRERRELLPVFICLYATIALMYIRNIYRCVEFVQGWDGYIATHEVYQYIFDAIVLYIAFIFYTVLHFGRYLPKPDSETAAGSGLPVSGSPTASEQGYPQSGAKAGSDAYGLQLTAGAGGARSGSPTSSEATASVRGVHIVSVYPDAAAGGGSPLAKPQPVAAARPPSASSHIGSHIGSRGGSRVPEVV